MILWKFGVTTVGLFYGTLGRLCTCLFLDNGVILWDFMWHRTLLCDFTGVMGIIVLGIYLVCSFKSKKCAGILQKCFQPRFNLQQWSLTKMSTQGPINPRIWPVITSAKWGAKLTEKKVQCHTVPYNYSTIQVFEHKSV